MLGSMRNASRNIFVKIFLGMLALSFIIWGVGDVFRGKTGNTVATVGDVQISYGEYSNYLQREIARYQQILGRALSEDQIKRFDIKNNVLENIIHNKLIRMRVADLNIKVGNDIAQKQILSNQMFRDESGKFSKSNFESVLQANSLNKNDYLAALKDDAAIGLFVDTMSARPASLKIQAATIYKYRNEQRFADILFIPSSYIKKVAEPAETDLVQYYQDNTSQFIVPEFREVTYLTFGVDSVKNEVAITDDELRAEYKVNIDSYYELESRDVVQYLFDKEANALIAFADLKAGKYTRYKSKKLPLGKVSREGLPAEIMGAVFGLDKGEISAPVKTALGWHIFIVNDVIDQRLKDFEEVKGEILSEVEEVRFSEAFFEFSNRIEDELAGDETIENVAKKFDLVMHKIASVDQNGKGTSGNKLKDVPERDVLVPLAFTTSAGMESPLTLLSDNSTYLVLRVDSVTQERVKALDEVKGSAIILWKKEERKRLLLKAANDISKKIQGGAKIGSIAKAKKLKLTRSKKVERPPADSYLSNGGDIPPMLAREVFSLNTGESTRAYNSASGGFVVASLKEVRAAEVDDGKLARLHEGLKNDFADDLFNQYNAYLRKEYTVQKHKGALDTAE